MILVLLFFVVEMNHNNGICHYGMPIIIGDCIYMCVYRCVGV
jgi:hypothetical protein